MQLQELHRAGLALLASALLLSACNGADTSESTSAPATTAVTASTSTLASATTATTTTLDPNPTTTVASGPLAESVIAQFGSFGPDLPIGATTGPNAGSGCEVEGETLPDGYWFGHILAYEIAAEAGSVRFDLACVDSTTGQNLIQNRTARLRDISLTPDTRFVFVREEAIFTPGSDAAAISSRLSDFYDRAWGWALVEDRAVSEFYLPGNSSWQNRTNPDRESIIPQLLHPDPTDDVVLVGPDGFDGSGCQPQSGLLPDGLWFGVPRFDGPNRLLLDLSCSVSDPDQIDRLGIDPDTIEDRTAVDDGDDTEYELSIAPDATLFMIGIDHNIFQTALNLDDPRFLHYVNGPQPPWDPRYTPGLWVLIENGVVVEGFNFFHP